MNRNPSRSKQVEGFSMRKINDFTKKSSFITKCKSFIPHALTSTPTPPPHHSNFHSVPPHPPNVVPHDDTTPSSLLMSKTIAIHIFNDINLTPSRHFQNSFFTFVDQPLTLLSFSTLSLFTVYIFNLSICLAVEKEEKD